VSLQLINIAKKFQKDWVFRNVSYTFQIPGTYVIKGANGSGKSTLLKLISSFLTSTEGTQKLELKGQSIEIEKWPEHITYAAPYFELINEMYLTEFLVFYTKFKPLQNGISIAKFIEIAYLEDSSEKLIKNFSSGMKQRLRLALAWLSESSIILLDEPTSNLDEKGIEWYKDLANTYSKNKLVIVCSNNIEDEYFFCKNTLHIEELKH
jgi:ABC-type multidrug transport system ATPase subunit